MAEAKDGTIPGDQIYEGCSGGKDGIPALTNPSTSDAQDVSFLDPSSRVIGVQVGEKAIAVPHDILWWHEIANISVEGLNLAVTLCPLTGSSLTFNRSTIGGAEFGVSGLLFKNNLIMYDRRSTESLWPQMMREAGKGEGAMAYRPALEGEELSFTVRDEDIVDVGTGSAWMVDGRATSGPMSGKRLEAVRDAYTAFWFAWAGFQPDTEIWTTGG